MLVIYEQMMEIVFLPENCGRKGHTSNTTVRAIFMSFCDLSPRLRLQLVEFTDTPLRISLL
jgi:hypothetical protein